MYAVIRSFPQMQNVEEAGRLAETGLAPILKQQPGFRAYYVIRLEGGGGGSISLFDNAENAKAAHDRSLTWIKDNLASMVGGAGRGRWVRSLPKSQLRQWRRPDSLRRADLAEWVGSHIVQHDRNDGGL